jgi:hypothetical protein
MNKELIKKYNNIIDLAENNIQIKHIIMLVLNAEINPDDFINISEDDEFMIRYIFNINFDINDNLILNNVNIPILNFINIKNLINNNEDSRIHLFFNNDRDGLLVAKSEDDIILYSIIKEEIYLEKEISLNLEILNSLYHFINKNIDNFQEKLFLKFLTSKINKDIENALNILSIENNIVFQSKIDIKIKDESNILNSILENKKFVKDYIDKIN